MSDTLEGQGAGREGRVSGEQEDQLEVEVGRQEMRMAWSRLGKGVERSRFERYFRGTAKRPC